MDCSLKASQIHKRDKIYLATKLLAEKFSFKTNEVRRGECANELDEMLENMRKETLEQGTGH